MALKPLMLMRKKTPFVIVAQKFANLKHKLATPAGGKN